MSAANDAPSKRLLLRTIALCLGGLAPLVTGLIGFWDYATQDYFIAKNGDIVDGPIGLVVCGLFVIAGLAMIIYAIRSYRRRL